VERLDVAIDAGDVSTVVHLRGDLSHETAGHLVTAVDVARRRCRGGLHLDLAGLDYLDSGGVQVILACWREWRDTDRPFTVSGQKGLPAEVLAVCGLTEVLSPPGGPEGA
jgi:anti-anti-sigma factor